MIDYSRLSEKAKEMLSDGITNVTFEELIEEFKLMDCEEVKALSASKDHYSYDPNAIYFATQQMLIMQDPSLIDDEDRLIKLADELFPKRLMQSVLLAINAKCEKNGMRTDDYRNKAIIAHNYIKEGVPIAYYANIVELTNGEEYSDCKFRGISVPYVVEKCFPNLKEHFLDRVKTDREREYYRSETLTTIFYFIIEWESKGYSEEYIERLLSTTLEHELRIQ